MMYFTYKYLSLSDRWRRMRSQVIWNEKLNHLAAASRRSCSAFPQSKKHSNDQNSFKGDVFRCWRERDPIFRTVCRSRSFIYDRGRKDEAFVVLSRTFPAACASQSDYRKYCRNACMVSRPDPFNRTVETSNDSSSMHDYRMYIRS